MMRFKYSSLLRHFLIVAGFAFLGAAIVGCAAQNLDDAAKPGQDDQIVTRR